MASATSSFVVFGLSCLVVLTMASDEFNPSFSRYLASGRSAVDKRAVRVVRLPPLVPPLHGDDSFSLRQVYNIPRVGKSLESSADDDDYALTSGSENAVRSQEERQVFSKIPRVGRRSVSS